MKVNKYMAKCWNMFLKNSRIKIRIQCDFNFGLRVAAHVYSFNNVLSGFDLLRQLEIHCKNSEYSRNNSPPFYFEKYTQQSMDHEKLSWIVSPAKNMTQPSERSMEAEISNFISQQ